MYVCVYIYIYVMNITHHIINFGSGATLRPLAPSYRVLRPVTASYRVLRPLTASCALLPRLRSVAELRVDQPFL